MHIFMYSIHSDTFWFLERRGEHEIDYILFIKVGHPAIYCRLLHVSVASCILVKLAFCLWYACAPLVHMADTMFVYRRTWHWNSILTRSPMSWVIQLPPPFTHVTSTFLHLLVFYVYINYVYIYHMCVCVFVCVYIYIYIYIYIYSHIHL